MSAPTAPPPVRTEPATTRPGRVAELRELSRTTPGVLIMFTAGLVAVSVLVGVLTAISVQSRAQALDNLSARSGPLADAAQDLYRALSDADATANSAFLSGGVEPAEMRTRYQDDIAQAANALAIAVAAREPADLADPNSPLAVLSSQLPAYTGIVEDARTNNRQGLPVGASYLREASNLMQAELLPAANELYRQQSEALADDQDQASSWPIAEVVLAIAALVVLFYAQRFVRRHSRRRINVGLAVATGAMVVSLVWVLLATIGVMANVNASRENGSDQTRVLAEARINALSARGNETLTLVARGSGEEFDKNYDEVRKVLTGQLAGASAIATDDRVRQSVRQAIDQENAWHEVHGEIRDADRQGDYPGAVGLALSTEPDGAATRFDALDNRLDHAIDLTTATFEEEVSQASGALTGTVIGVILLALVMAVGAVTGIWQRLKEYR
jgi:tetrahydromethanopterin S-methyltransferase subunit G